MKCLNKKGVVVKVSAKINAVRGNRVNFTAGISGCLAVTTELKALYVL